MRSVRKTNGKSRRERFAYTASQEDYLKSVNLLAKRGAVRNSDIATHMGIARSSVTRGVSILKSKGLVKIIDRTIELTDEGRELADELHGKYMFCVSLLTWAGLDEETADKEACLIEHTLSDASFAALKTAFGKMIGIVPS